MGHASDNFKRLRVHYFDPLIEAIGLECVGSKTNEMYGFVEAAGMNVRVRFEHDRGLSKFAIAAVADPARHWGASIVAVLFPRIRVMPGGEQRLTLDEQAQLLRTKWPELERFFAEDQLLLTVARLQAETDRCLSRLGMKAANNSLDGGAAKLRASKLSVSPQTERRPARTCYNGW